MKKDILKIIAVVLILESVYTIYQNFASVNPYWFSLLFFAIVPVLMIIAGIGLFLKKEWAVIVFWIAFAFPSLDVLLLRGFSLPGLGALISVVNIAILIYLSNQKGKLEIEI